MEAAGSSKTFATSQTTVQKTIILIQSRGWKYLELLYYFFLHHCWICSLTSSRPVASDITLFPSEPYTLPIKQMNCCMCSQRYLICFPR